MNNVSIIVPETIETPNLRNGLSSNCNIDENMETDSAELIQEENLAIELETVKEYLHKVKFESQQKEIQLRI